MSTGSVGQDHPTGDVATCRCAPCLRIKSPSRVVNRDRPRPGAGGGRPTPGRKSPGPAESERVGAGWHHVCATVCDRSRSEPAG
eukprot:748688-Hanusia_phi.AAC.1